MNNAFIRPCNKLRKLSKLLGGGTVAKLERLYKATKNKLEPYNLYIVQGNKETEVHTIGKAHEMTLEMVIKLLTGFKRLDE